MPPEEKRQSRKEIKRGGGAPQCSHHCSGISPLHCDGQVLPQVGEGLGFPGGRLSIYFIIIQSIYTFLQLYISSRLFNICSGFQNGCQMSNVLWLTSELQHLAIRLYEQDVPLRKIAFQWQFDWRKGICSLFTQNIQLRTILFVYQWFHLRSTEIHTSFPPLCTEHCSCLGSTQIMHKHEVEVQRWAKGHLTCLWQLFWKPLYTRVHWTPPVLECTTKQRRYMTVDKETLHMWVQAGQNVS